MGVKRSCKLMCLALLTAELCLGSHIEVVFVIPGFSMNLMGAKSFCQRNYTDLVTRNIVELFELAPWMVEKKLTTAWIDQPSDSERGSVQLLNAVGFQGSEGNENDANCSCFQPLSKKWYAAMCSALYPCVCYEDNLVVVTENKTWDSALEHCRNMTTATRTYDLLTLPDSSEDTYVRERIQEATTNEVWIGLRFLEEEWYWLDGSTVKHHNKLPDCPTQWQHCGTMSKNDTNKWIIRDCAERRNFICHYEETET